MTQKFIRKSPTWDVFSPPTAGQILSLIEAVVGVIQMDIQKGNLSDKKVTYFDINQVEKHADRYIEIRLEIEE